MLPQLKTILYCTQMGPNTPYVFRWAASLARNLDAQIIVLHVIEGIRKDDTKLVEGYTGEGSLSEVVSEQEQFSENRLRARVEEFCRKASAEHFQKERITGILVIRGKVRQVILEQIEKHKPDIVVMGAHAQATMIERLMGSSTQQVISESPVPVLVVQVPEGKQDMSQMT